MPCTEAGWARGNLLHYPGPRGSSGLSGGSDGGSSFQSPLVLEWLGFFVAGAKALFDRGLMLPSFPFPAVRTLPASESNATARV